MICPGCGAEVARTWTIWRQNGSREEGCRLCVGAPAGRMILGKVYNKFRGTITAAHADDIKRRKIVRDETGKQVAVARDYGRRVFARP